MSFSLFSTKKEQKQKIEFKKNRKNFLLMIIFISAMALLVPVLEFISFFAPLDKKAILWRKTAIKSIGILFFLGGLKIKIEGKRPKSERMIYISNHLSHLDGFILLYVLGPDTTPITAPINYFQFPFSHWFKKMEFIDVQRSELEKKKYRKSHSGGEAINEAIEELHGGHSILIFPEGHISFQKRLLYFHSGATRMALATDTKISPIAIINIENLTYSKYFFTPGLIKVVFGKPIDAVKYYKKNISNVKDTSQMLKIKVSSLLPREYLPLDFQEKHPEQTGAFFNINNTIYRGNAMLDLIFMLWRKGKFKFSDLLFLTFLIFLYKIKILEEHSLIKKGVRTIKGLRADSIYNDIHEIFYNSLNVKISEKIKIIITDHKKKGHKIIFISRMISPLVKIFADYLGADYYSAEYLKEEKLKFTGNIIENGLEKNKGEQLKQIAKLSEINPLQSFAYGHDENDLPFLGLVKYKNLVNPKKEMLENFENNKEFEIIKT